jgi:hypothetical protein
MLNREVGFALNNGHGQPSLKMPKGDIFWLRNWTHRRQSCPELGLIRVKISSTGAGGVTLKVSSRT